MFEPYKIMDLETRRWRLWAFPRRRSFYQIHTEIFPDASGAYIYSFCEDETGQGLYSRVQESVDSARAAGADYVILVSHLGNEGVTPRWSSSAVVAATNGIDAVIDGHSHETVPAAVLTNMDGKAVSWESDGNEAG